MHLRPPAEAQAVEQLVGQQGQEGGGKAHNEPEPSP